jgi:type IX secretion system PorP/SprF family membrane protein
MIRLKIEFMKKIVGVAILCLLGFQGFSQQDPQYSMYMFNPLAVNPGYAGSRELLSGVLVHRSQWIGLEGSPKTQAFSINAPLMNKKMGLGLQIINDVIGAHTTQSLKGTYVYRIKMGNGKLAFGLTGGMINYNYDWSAVEYKDEGDAVPANANENFMLPTIDFGLYYNTQTLYAGFAAEHLNQSSYGLQSGVKQGLDNSSGSGAKQTINLTATFGKAIVINQNLILKASALFRYANASRSLDLNLGFLLKKKILFGAAVRQSAIIVMTEINLSKNLRMGIAYDVSGGNSTALSTGSLEVFLGYDLGLFKSKVVSPRYF